MKVLLFTEFYLPGYKGGGPIKTIKNLIDSTGESISYKIITSDRDLGDKTPYNNVDFNDWNNIVNSDIFYLSPDLKGLIQIFKLITKTDYDILYLNSFFSPKFSLLPLIINKLTDKQVVLGPRGEFSKGALKLKKPKKKAYIHLFKLLNIQKNIIFQASNQHESQDINNTLGNNVDVYIAEDIGSKELAHKLSAKDPALLKGIFISRISPKKNLLLALDILDGIKESVSYDIYGPIEDSKYWRECESKISKLPPNIKVTYKGKVEPRNVISTLSKYDFFFMPTQGENYGHVIAEALCAGLPLVISDTTPWKNLELNNLGWDLSLDDLQGFRSAITYLSKLSPTELLNKRQNILKWSKTKFTKNDAVKANINMFQYAYKKMSDKRK